MRMKLGMGTAVAVGLVAWAATGIGATAQKPLETIGGERFVVQAPREAPRQHETGQQEAPSQSESPQDFERSPTSETFPPNGPDEALRHERARWQPVTHTTNKTPEVRSTKAATQREAAQFGVITLLSTMRHCDEEKPSPWAHAAIDRSPSDRARDPEFDGTIDGPLGISLSSE